MYTYMLPKYLFTYERGLNLSKQPIVYKSQYSFLYHNSPNCQNSLGTYSNYNTHLPNRNDC